MRDYSKIRINEKAWQNKNAWKLYQENWRICHEIVELRDGYFCQIPDCGVSTSLQLDHAISRQCKTLFFETDILGYLCDVHHTHKSSRKGQWVDLMVNQIFRNRVGEERYEDLIFESKKTCGKHRTLSHQEEVNMKLKEERAMLLAERPNETVNR